MCIKTENVVGKLCPVVVSRIIYGLVLVLAPGILDFNFRVQIRSMYTGTR